MYSKLQQQLKTCALELDSTRFGLSWPRLTSSRHRGHSRSVDDALSAFRSPTLPLHCLFFGGSPYPLNVVESQPTILPIPMPRQKKGKARQQALVPEGGGGEGDLGV